MSEISQQNTEINAMALYKVLRKNTEKSKTTGRKQLLFNLPEGLTREQTVTLLDGIGTENAAPELKDMIALKGRKDTWYYDGTIMTGRYAELDSMIQEKDILHTIATVTRSDSALYPKTTEFRKLQDMPFWFTEDELLGAAARFQLEPGYEDIKVLTASTGMKAFYSTKSLSEAYAKALLEWYEVGLSENP